jgi:ParB-like chromosome segregation protein Spo0J
MTDKLTWLTEKRRINDLKYHPKNPRDISSENEKQLKRSLKKFGYAEIIAINRDNTILAGHQRIAILRKLEGDDFEIELRVPNRYLSKKEAEEYLVRSNKNIGEWNFELLQEGFNLDDLSEWGFLKPDFVIEEKPLKKSSKEKSKKICPNCGTEF